MSEALRSALEERVVAAVREGEEELVGLVSSLGHSATVSMFGVAGRNVFSGAVSPGSDGRSARWPTG